MATLKNNSAKSSVSLGVGVFIILSVVVGFIVIGYFIVKVDKPYDKRMNYPTNIIKYERSNNFSKIAATVDTLYVTDPNKLLSLYRSD